MENLACIESMKDVCKSVEEDENSSVILQRLKIQGCLIFTSCFSYLCNIAPVR